MKDQVVVRVLGKALIPFIFVFGFYIIMHGEGGPGGGFQGGVVLAAGFILYGLIFGLEDSKRVLPTALNDCLIAIGALFYIGVGVTTMLLGGAFLDYSKLNKVMAQGEPLGMTLVEMGVGLTVCCVMITIFNQVAELRSDQEEKA